MTDQQTTAIQKITMNPLEAIIVKGKDGTFRQIRATAKLSTLDGTLVKFGGGGGDDEADQQQGGQQQQKKATYIMSAVGFNILRGLCGVTVLHPATLTIDGQEQPNPYCDNASGKVYCRAVAIGYTHLGQLAMSDRTVIYDYHVANLQDLIAKAAGRWGKGKFAMWPRNEDANGKLIRPSELTERWAPYIIDEAMVMWVDTGAPDVWKWQREMTNRKSKAERTAQTFADRNAVAAHPALPPNRKFSTPTIALQCVSWFAESGNLRFDQSLLSIDPAKLMEANPGAQVTRGTDDLNKDATATDVAGETVDVDDVREDDDEELDEHGEKIGGPSTKKTDPQPTETVEELQAAVKVMEQRIGVKGPIKRAREAVEMKMDVDIATVTDTKVLAQLRDLLQAALPST